MSVVEIERDRARSWTERWLGAGHVVSAAVLASAPFDRGRFRTCVADGVTSERLRNFDEGYMAKVTEADAWLAQTLDELSRNGARCVVAEHDLASRTDPFIVQGEDPWAFIGDRVIAWSDIGPGGGAAAVKEVKGVGSGYPSNAFVVTHSAAELGIFDRQQVPENFSSRVAESLLAVIVAVFDAESYLVWDTP